jgi:N-acetylglucosamine kinase-like BadF-type ATPase
MKYLIGIDGGGTKTKCIVTGFDLKQLYETTGGPSNFLVFGADKVSENIFQLLGDCAEKLNCGFDDFVSIVLGTAGAGRRKDAETMEQSFTDYIKSKNFSLKKFRVESDARISLEGAFSGKPGSILIAGTGSIMFGKDEKENIHRVGGFGRYIGDEGSGYSIGKKGFNALSKFYDGRGELTMLSKLVSDHFHINDPESLISAVYKNNFDIASIAQDVIYAAKKDDPVCVRIVNEETDELILHIKTMKAKLKQTSLDVCFTGSIITTDNFFSRTLLKKIREQFPDVNIKEPDHPPAMGAIFMAKKLTDQQ